MSPRTKKAIVAVVAAVLAVLAALGVDVPVV